MLVEKSLHVVDYILFAAMLAVSLGIGIYHSQAGGKQRTTGEYLMADRKMKLIPVSLSLMVSFISSILLLGYPAEMYVFGAQLWTGMFGWAMGAALACVLFVPVFFPLKLTSINNYLQLRYRSSVLKWVGTISAVLGGVLYTAVVYFGPSTAIEAVSGFPAWASILIASAVSIAYTTIGGIKAVVWTDVFQAIVMLVGMLAAVIQGTVSLGGFDRIFTISNDWGRLHFLDFDPDPTKRMNFWGLIIAHAITSAGVYGYLQTGVQRYCSVPTLGGANKVVLGVIPGILVMTSLACISGLTVFAYYAHQACDPLGAGYIQNSNQLVPYFVLDVFSVPGMTGVFLAAVSSASLSSASSAMNAGAANLWDDIIHPICPHVTEKTAATITKSLVLILGLISSALAFAIMGLGGTIVQIMGTFASILWAPAASLFYMGIFLPWVNWIGGLAGSIVSLIFGTWVAIGSYSIKLHLDILPAPTDGCTANSTRWNITDMYTTMAPVYSSSSSAFSNSSHLYSGMPSMDSTEETRSGLHTLYSISFVWMPILFILVGIFTSVIVSTLTGNLNPREVDSKLLHPLTRWLLKLPAPVYDNSSSIDTKPKMPTKDLTISWPLQNKQALSSLTTV